MPKELARGRVVDRLRRRAQGNAERLRTQREVVVLVTREACQIKHDHEMHAALVQSTVREQVLKLAAIRGLGALAFLGKAFEDLVTLAATVFLAGTSECQPKRQLNLAVGPGRTGDRCYIPGTHSRSGESELGSVKRIEHFRAECK